MWDSGVYSAWNNDYNQWQCFIGSVISMKRREVNTSNAPGALVNSLLLQAYHVTLTVGSSRYKLTGSSIIPELQFSVWWANSMAQNLNGSQLYKLQVARSPCNITLLHHIPTICCMELVRSEKRTCAVGYFDLSIKTKKTFERRRALICCQEV